MFRPSLTQSRGEKRRARWDRRKHGRPPRDGHEPVLNRVCVWPLNPEEPNNLDYARRIASCLSAAGVTVASDPRRGVPIILAPSFANKWEGYEKLLLADAAVRDHLQHCVVFESCDLPKGWLRGSYASRSARCLDATRERAIGHLLGDDLADTQALIAHPPSLLFSFRGALSHPIRQRLLQLKSDAPHALTRVDRWFDHSREERQDYRVEIADSQFVLCPRGIGPATLRVQETLQHGRVPVIISDDWAPPQGPNWGAFSVRVSESDLAHIPSIVSHLAPQAREMGLEARAAWERWFKPGESFGHWLHTQLHAVLDAPVSPPDEIARWTSPAFLWNEGLDPIHRLARRVTASTGHSLLSRWVHRRS